MSEHAEIYRGLWWEWLTARVVFVLGFGVPIVAAIVFMVLYPSPQQTAASSRQLAGQEFCEATVAVAQSFGIVPNFAKATGQPQNSDVRGRYVCTAATNAAKYAIAVDLVCRNITDPHCYNIYSITQDDGSVIYQRQG